MSENLRTFVVGNENNKLYTMKKVVLLACCVMLTSICFSINRIQVVINYQGGVYRGATYGRIIAEERDFLKDKPHYEGRFFEGLTDVYACIAYAPDTINPNEPVAYLDILQVTNKGNILAEVTYDGKKEELNAKGGVFGSFLNLMGDGMASLGKALGAWLNTLPAASAQ